MSDPIENTDEATDTSEVGNNESVDTEGDTASATPSGDVTENNDDIGLTRRDIKYRERLRETETERDQLRATVESMQRREVERLAAEHLVKPGALWTIGTELATLLGEDGTVDPEKVRAAAVTAREQHGLEDPKAAKLRGPVVPREGSSVRAGSHKSGSWTDAFKSAG